MAQFEPAFDYVIVDEAGPKISGIVTPEPGGAKARFGINSLAHPKAVTDGFYEMPYDQALAYAKNIYKVSYWDNHGFDNLASQQLATKLFDAAINMGSGGEIGVLQRALGVPVTHIMDATTVAAENTVGPGFLQTLVTKLEDYYKSLATAHPDKYAKYLSNWLHRADKLPPSDI